MDTNDVLNCKNCFMRFTLTDRRPRIFICGKTFCTPCCTELINKTPVKCPICKEESRKKYQNVNKLPIDDQVEKNLQGLNPPEHTQDENNYEQLAALTKDAIKCKICFEEFSLTDRRPRSFNCGHSICTPCCAKLLSKPPVKCPQCRKIPEENIKQVNEIPIAFQVEEILQALGTKLCDTQLGASAKSPPISESNSVNDGYDNQKKRKEEKEDMTQDEFHGSIILQAKLKNKDYTNYDEENKGKNVQKKEKGDKEDIKSHKYIVNKPKFTPIDLVQALSNSKHFKRPLFDIIDEFDLKPSVIKDIIHKNKGTFTRYRKYVVLQPQIDLCNKYNLNGCRNVNCNSLHLCQNFVYKKCTNKSCLYEHNLNNKHNNKVIDYFHVGKLSPGDILDLVTSVSYSAHSDTTSNYQPPSVKQKNSEQKKLDRAPTVQSKICMDYNKNRCTDEYCSLMHICVKYLKYKKACAIPCKLNHDIIDPSFEELLSNVGISTKQTTQDIITALCKHIGIYDHDMPDDSKSSYSKKISHDSRYSSNPKQYLNTIEGSNEIGDNGRDTSPLISYGKKSKHGKPRSIEKTPKRGYTDDAKDKIPKRSNIQISNISGESTSKKATESASDYLQTNQKSQRQTVYAIDLYGDTQHAEICYYSVESKCKYEDIGCIRLHSRNHFHWQVSKKGKTWVNLHVHQILQLEKAYCDENVINTDLDDIDLSKDDRHNVLFQLLGKDPWAADFGEMSLSNSNTDKQLILRRFCSERIAGSEKQANTFVWYFEDENRKWIPYGKVDSTGKQWLKSQINSNEIERTYQQNGSKGTMHFSNAMFKYIIDFDKMLQINLKTKSKRKMRRRPNLDNKFQNKG